VEELVWVYYRCASCGHTDKVLEGCLSSAHCGRCGGRNLIEIPKRAHSAHQLVGVLVFFGVLLIIATCLGLLGLK
jgi:hypothetical protein